jgi:hypothetical protein
MGGRVCAARAGIGNDIVLVLLGVTQSCVTPSFLFPLSLYLSSCPFLTKEKDKE